MGNSVGEHGGVIRRGRYAARAERRSCRLARARCPGVVNREVNSAARTTHSLGGRPPTSDVRSMWEVRRSRWWAGHATEEGCRTPRSVVSRTSLVLAAALARPVRGVVLGRDARTEGSALSISRRSLLAARNAPMLGERECPAGPPAESALRASTPAAAHPSHARARSCAGAAPRRTARDVRTSASLRRTASACIARDWADGWRTPSDAPHVALRNGAYR